MKRKSDRKQSDQPGLSVNTFRTDMLLNDLDMPLPSIRELANKADTQLSFELANSRQNDDLNQKPKLKLNENTRGFRLGLPAKAVFTSSKEIYSKTGALMTPVKPGIYTLPIRAPDYRVRIYDYNLDEIQKRNFSRRIVKFKRKESEEDLSDFKLGNALG